MQCLFIHYSVISTRLHRFYVSQPLGEDVVIDDVSLIKQWSKVFRYKKGDLVILFNGEGTDATYSIETLSSKNIVLIRISLSPSYTPEKKVTLYLSLLKKDNFELAVQKVTELGVTTIIPILSERSEKKNINEKRLNKIAIESSEQCGRGDIPTILPIMSLSEILETQLPHDISYALQINGEPLDNSIAKQDNKINSFGLFIGPEGGWSDREEKMFKEKNIKLVSIGKTILRAETASIVSCAFILRK